MVKREREKKNKRDTLKWETAEDIVTKDRYGNPQFETVYRARNKGKQTVKGKGKVFKDFGWISEPDWKRSIGKIEAKDNYLFSDTGKRVQISTKALRDFDRKDFLKKLKSKNIENLDDIKASLSKDQEANDALLHLVAKKTGWNEGTIKDKVKTYTLPSNVDMDKPNKKRNDFINRIRGIKTRPEIGVSKTVTHFGAASINNIPDRKFKELAEKTDPDFAESLEKQATSHLKKTTGEIYDPGKKSSMMKDIFLKRVKNGKYKVKTPGSKKWDEGASKLLIVGAKLDGKEWENQWTPGEELDKVAGMSKDKLKNKFDGVIPKFTSDQEYSKYEQSKELDKIAKNAMKTKTGEKLLAAFSVYNPKLKGTKNEHMIIREARKNKKEFVEATKLLMEDSDVSKSLNERSAKKTVKAITGLDLDIKKPKREKKMSLTKKEMKDDFAKELSKYIKMGRSSAVVQHLTKKAPDEIVEAVAKKKISAAEAAQHLSIDGIEYRGDQASNPKRSKLRGKISDKLRAKGIQVSRDDISGSGVSSSRSGGGGGTSKSKSLFSKEKVVETKPGKYEIRKEKGRIRSWFGKATKGKGTLVKTKVPYTKERKAYLYQKYKPAVGEKEAEYLAAGKGTWPWSKYFGRKRAERMSWDEAYRSQQMARKTKKEGWGRYKVERAVRESEQLQKVAASPWRVGFHKLSQRMTWLIVALLVIGVLFLPMGLFHVVGWSLAVGAVALINMLVWVFMEFWFLLAQGIVAVISFIGQAFVMLVNYIGMAIGGALGQDFHNFNFNLVQDLTIPNIHGLLGQGETWGSINLVPPSFLKLDWYMPTVFDTDTLIAKIIPGISGFFNTLYGPIAERYTNWIASAEWYMIGVIIGLPIIIALILIGVAILIKRKMAERMY